MLFVLVTAQAGVRIGRAVRAICMTGLDKRAAYTAHGNSMAGIVLPAGGLFGVVAYGFGIARVLVLIALLATGAASRLNEVQPACPGAD